MTRKGSYLLLEASVYCTACGKNELRRIVTRNVDSLPFFHCRSCSCKNLLLYTEVQPSFDKSYYSSLNHKAALSKKMLFFVHL